MLKSFRFSPSGKRSHVDDNGHFLTKEDWGKLPCKFISSSSQLYKICNAWIFRQFLYITHRVYSRLWPVSLQRQWWYSWLPYTCCARAIPYMAMSSPLRSRHGRATVHHMLCTLSCILELGLFRHARRHSPVHQCVGSACLACR